MVAMDRQCHQLSQHLRCWSRHSSKWHNRHTRAQLRRMYRVVGVVPLVMWVVQWQASHRQLGISANRHCQALSNHSSNRPSTQAPGLFVCWNSVVELPFALHWILDLPSCSVGKNSPTNSDHIDQLINHFGTYSMDVLE